MNPSGEKKSRAKRSLRHKGEPGNGAISPTKGEPGNGPALCRRSQNYRLRLQEPDSELEALRGSRPPELPAGKRGGWLRDSVYPRFRLTSFAPRALNFEAECTSRRAQRAPRLIPRCHADTSPCVAPRTRPLRRSRRRGRWGGCWRKRGWSSSTAVSVEFPALRARAPREPVERWSGSCPRKIVAAPTPTSPSRCRRGWARHATS